MASYTDYKEENSEKSIVLCQLLDMFEAIIDKSIIETVAQSCDYTIQECIDTLISCVENAEVRNIYEKKPANHQEPLTSTSNATAISQTPSQVTKDHDSPQDQDVVMRSPSPANFKEDTFWYTGCEKLYSNVSKTSKPATECSAAYPDPRSPNDEPVRDCETPSSSKMPPCVSSPQGAIAKLGNPAVIEDQIRRGYKVLVILRGLPGSGKTHYAKSLIFSTIGICNLVDFIFSTDNFFVDNWGMYKFDPYRLDEAHRYNQNRVLKAARKGVSPIIVDNTNTQLWEMAPYIHCALENGYFLHIVESTTPWAWNIYELSVRNVHRVTKSKIQHMADRFERGLTVDHCMRRLNLKPNPCKKPPQMRSYPPLEVREEPKPQREVHTPKPQRIRKNVSLKNAVISSTENLIDLDYTDGDKKKDLVSEPTSYKSEKVDQGQKFTSLMDGKEIQQQDQDKEILDLVSKMKSFLNEETDETYSLMDSEATLPAEEKDSSEEEASTNNNAISLEKKSPALVVDNLNSINWQETPFPGCDLVLPKPEPVREVVQTCESSTNTSAADIVQKGEGSYEVLIARARDINEGLLVALDDRPQRTLMLHKSSMTDDINFYELIEDDEEKKQCLDSLVEMFQHVPKEHIISIYANACNYDLNWATEMLLDERNLEALKYKIEDPTQFDFVNLPPVQEKKKHRSSSKSAPRRKENDEETLKLKNYLEEKVQHKEASYNPHILRVKRWKQRQSDMDVEEIERQAQDKNAIEFKKLRPTSTSASDSSSESIESDSDSNESKSSSSNSLSDEMIEVTVGKEFIENLEKLFGSSEFAFPDGIFPVIQMKKSQAQELYALWLESMQQQQKVHDALLNECIENDEEYARLIERQEQTQDEVDYESKMIVEQINKDLDLQAFSHLSKEEKKTYADKVRQKGIEEFHLYRRNVSKSNEAYENCNVTAGHLHSKLARHHEKKLQYLNLVASGMFVTLSQEKHNEETLDLHNLYVKEAVEAVNIFLSHHIQKLSNRPVKHVTLFIITGRGLNSNGQSRIKPAVCKFLRNENIKYTDANPGCLKVTLRKNNLVYLRPR